MAVIVCFGAQYLGGRSNQSRPRWWLLYEQGNVSSLRDSPLALSYPALPCRAIGCSVPPGLLLLRPRPVAATRCYFRGKKGLFQRARPRNDDLADASWDKKVKASGGYSPSLVQIRFLEDEESLMTAGETAGPSTSLRYGRDDNSVAGSTTVPSHLFPPLQNCHPDRSAAKGRDPQCALRLSQIFPRSQSRMHHLFRIMPSPRNLISLVADCCTRLANKINAARSTNPLIWTALIFPFP
jgi:hypothetical protein